MSPLSNIYDNIYALNGMLPYWSIAFKLLELEII